MAAKPPPTRFFEAMARGDTNTVRDYVKNGLDTNYRDEDEGTTLLYSAVSWGHVGVVQVLVQYGASVNDLGSELNGEYVLHVAASRGSKEIADVLLTAGASVDIQSRQAGDRYCATPLMCSCACFEIKGAPVGVMESLLAAGANPNARDARERTALMYLAESPWPRPKDLLAMAEMLIKAGAEVDAKDQDGLTPGQLAGKLGYVDMAEYFAKQ